MKRPVTTRYAAKEVGISLMTLQRWIANEDIRAPRLEIVNGRAMRIWEADDLARLRRLHTSCPLTMGRWVPFCWPTRLASTPPTSRVDTYDCAGIKARQHIQPFPAEKSLR